jgi:hypothetical protein
LFRDKGEALGAPIIKSSKPSLLKSPAEDIEYPLPSNDPSPLIVAVWYLLVLRRSTKPKISLGTPEGADEGCAVGDVGWLEGWEEG